MDFISEFLRATEELLSTREFRLWAAISAVAGALERRVYTIGRSTKPTYPNLYVCLAGISGSGKTEAINIARDLWAELDNFFLAPDNVTPAAFYESLAGSLKARINGNGFDAYCAMTVCNRELGVLFPVYDRGWLADLSDLWDNQNSWEASRKTVKSARMECPTVNILCGVTPKYLGDVMPEIAWGQGFAARMLYIYGHRARNGAAEPVDVLKPMNQSNLKNLESLLKGIYSLEGACYWTPSAHVAVNAWHHDGELPVPQHSRLEEYSTRRLQHAVKLSMISAASMGHGLEIHKEDFDRALEWLTDAEEQMPNVFRSMAAKSDTQILNDLHYHFWAKYSSVKREDRKPFPEKDLWNWLKDRVESHRIQGILNTAQKTGMFKKGFIPDEWVPEPFNRHVMV